MVRQKKQQECTSCNKCDDACKIQQRIFEREVDEELQQERLQQLWQKYKWLVIGGIIVVLGGTIGYELYRSWWHKTRLAESDMYEAAVLNAHTGKADAAIDGLTDLGETGKTGYQYLAQMETAGILLAANREADALPILADLMANDSAPAPLRASATLAYVGHQLETGDAAELQALLKPLLTAQSGAFAGLAAELSAVLFIRQGQPKEAALVIEQALGDENIPLPTRERLTHLLSEVQ